jgi:hypothetical protein
VIFTGRGKGNEQKAAKSRKKSIHALLNAARRQTILAFREKGVWKISKESK